MSSSPIPARNFYGLAVAGLIYLGLSLLFFGAVGDYGRMYLLGRYLTRDTLASLIGGYLFGFSSYELGEMPGHLNLDTIFVVPLVVLLANASVTLTASATFIPKKLPRNVDGDRAMRTSRATPGSARLTSTSDRKS